MGDRVLFQCHRAGKEFGPVVYGHWAGSEAPEIVSRLAQRMQGRGGDVDYSSARLVQEVLAECPDGNTGIGVWNAERLLTAEDSHGDAGVVLIDVDNGHAVQYLGGYLKAA